MKVKLVAAAVAALLLATADVASAQPAQPSDGGQTYGQSQGASSQSTMRSDTGGAYDYGAQSGGRNGYGKTRNGQACVVGLSCDIYQGS